MEPKVAVVTGGASGMGKNFALRMAARGTKVAILDVNKDGLEETAKASENIVPFQCDMSNESMVREVIDKIVAQLGPIDRLVQAAAIMPAFRLEDHAAEGINRMMAINYGGTVNIVQAVLPLMNERHSGEIIIFGSIAGDVPSSHFGAYCASKAATNFYAEILIEENRGSGVHILLVKPPMVDTPLMQQATDNSNPKNIQNAIAKNQLVSPDFIIDKIEQALVKKSTIIYPGLEAKIPCILRRLSTRFMWWMVNKGNEEQGGRSAITGSTT